VNPNALVLFDRAKAKGAVPLSRAPYALSSIFMTFQVDFRTFRRSQTYPGNLVFGFIISANTYKTKEQQMRKHLYVHKTTLQVFLLSIHVPILTKIYSFIRKLESDVI
jgi:hypothetical protein